MSLPYIAHRREIAERLGAVEQPNLGQIFYRYLHPPNDKAKQTLAAEFVQLANHVLGRPDSQALLKAIHARQKEQIHALQQSGYEPGHLQGAIAWRLLVGSSVGRVWDMGVQLHPLYGLPFLPASAIKGMLAHYCEEENKHDRNPIFGELDRQGEVIFFDAFCLAGAPTYFEEDIVNPNYPEYYSDGTSAPADYCDPIPVKFAALAGGVQFVFRFVQRRSDPAVNNWLREALENYGIGAKTRVGYGRFCNFA